MDKTSLYNQASAIRNATQSAENTAERVGRLFKEIIDELGDWKALSDLINQVYSSFDGEYLSRVKPDTAEDVITFLRGLVSQAMAYFKDGAEFGEFVSGMMTGMGAAIDKNGNAEVQSLTVRTVMKVMELIINRIGAQEGDTLFSESDTIDTLTDNGDGTWTLKVKSKYDGYFTAMTPGMVVKGMINNLASGGTDYYTSWMRVNSVNTSDNVIEVSLYPDDEVPAGQNFPPCELMRMCRWGHQTDKTRQSIFYISSTEGRIVRLSGVTKPIIDASNYGTTFGELPEFLFDEHPELRGMTGLYAQVVAAETFINVDYQGRPLPTVRDRGLWKAYDPDDTSTHYYSGDVIREATRDYEQSDVWYLGCRWRCCKTKTQTAPRWNNTDWAFVEGNPAFEVDFAECDGTLWLDPDNINATLTIIATLYHQDVTADILPTDIEWLRYSEDLDGNPRTASDNAWALSHTSATTQLTITADDLGCAPEDLSRLEFRVKVTLRDGMNEPIAQDTASIAYSNE